MLQREDRLDVQGLADYLGDIVKVFVEQPDKVVVTFDEFPRRVIFHLSVAGVDLPTLQEYAMTYRSLNHIIRKATVANIDREGALDDQIGVTPE
jgi:hypothetical protein